MTDARVLEGQLKRLWASVIAIARADLEGEQRGEKWAPTVEANRRSAAAWVAADNDDFGSFTWAAGFCDLPIERVRRQLLAHATRRGNRAGFRDNVRAP